MEDLPDARYGKMIPTYNSRLQPSREEHAAHLSSVVRHGKDRSKVGSAHHAVLNTIAACLSWGLTPYIMCSCWLTALHNSLISMVTVTVTGTTRDKPLYLGRHHDFYPLPIYDLSFQKSSSFMFSLIVVFHNGDISAKYSQT